MSPRIGARRRIGTIRTSLVLLALVPGVTLTTIWAVTATQAFDEGWRLRSQTGLSRSTGELGTEVTLALQQERRLSAQRMALSGGAGRRAGEALDRQRRRTDAEVRKLVARADELKKAPPRIRDRMYPVTAAAENLEYYRSQVDNPTDVHARQVLEQYTDIIGAQINAFQELSQGEEGNLTTEAAPLVAIERAAELLSQEDAILTPAWSRGRLSAGEYAEFARLVGARRWLFDTQITPFVNGTTKTAVEQIITSAEWRVMESVEDEVMIAYSAARGPSTGVPLRDMSKRWRSALDRLSAEHRELIRQRTSVFLDHSSEKARALLDKAAWVSIGGLAAVLLSTVLSWRIARSLSRRLRGLREATLRLAESRLPDVVARLHRGERIDVDAETPSLDYGHDELGQVAQAFNAAQRTAVGSAVELVEARRGFQKVILGVARHTQNLVNRQLSTLDTLEREHQDPMVLEGLYELDSTASQMRRYEENLVIISGGQPGRRWSQPVEMVDVVRGAVGEVADYRRVNVHVRGEARLAAPAVADVIHLLAELIENATVFSPAPNPVQVRAEVVVRGMAVEIEDRGVGMTEKDYNTANRHLAEPPQFDVMALADDSRLGMFVVGRLAARHGVRVTLRSSPFGGTTAIVLLPEEVIVRDSPEESPDGQAPGSAPEENGSAGQPTEVPLPQRQPISDRGTPLGLVPAAAPTGHAHPSDEDGGLHGTPGPGEPDGQEHPAPVAAPVPAPAPALAVAAEVTPLPRRVPQTSLAEELRQEPPSPEAAGAGDASAEPAPSAEQAASSLSAFQRGTKDARDQNTSRVPTEDT